jgi:CrcB protein
MNYLIVFIGGFFGAILRFLIGNIIHPLSNGFPMQTFLINVIGCFFLGFFLPFAKIRLKLEFSLLIGTGFTGAFTTFSSFSMENVKLINGNQIIISLLYIFSSLIVGIGFSYLGYKLSNYFTKVKGESAV